MILPDYPIENNDEDKLRRTPLANKVAELIVTFKGKESFVIGIEGIWGSGKTSFINLVLQSLKGNDDLIIVHFNPWNFSGQNELISDFFSTLIADIEPFQTDKNKVKKIKGIVSKLTKKSEIAFSPEVSVLGLVNFKANDLFKFGGEEKTLQQERKEVDKLFNELGKKVVIVIDDIDRLDTEETRLVMKLVKMTANFPNTVFVLAYDRKRVAEKLDTDGSGEDYLKKIIQVSFTLPTPDQQGLQKILFGDLDETIKGVYGVVKIEDEDEKRWNDILYAGFKDLFKTVRDIKRFISSLRLNWSIIGKDDINQIDFIAIEAIRVFAHRFYSQIPSNINVFMATRYSSFSVRDNATERENQYKELLKEVPDDIRKPIDGICKALFPKLDFRTSFADGFEQRWRKERRICTEERFGFYFQLGIPEGAISETEANAVVSLLSDKGAFSEKLLELSKENRLRPMLNKLMDKLDGLDVAKVKILISSLWDLEKQIADERSAIFDFDDVETQTTRIAFHSIKTAIKKEERLVLLEELLKNSKTFYYPVRFVAILGDQHKENGGRIEPPLIEKEEAEKLNKIGLEKIKKMSADGTLQKEEQLIFALFRWKEWENAEVVKEYIKKMISTRDGLLIFLRGFVGRVLSTNGNYNRLDKQGIEQLYPLSEIETLVGQITDDELKTFVDKDKETINLFRNPPREW